MTTDKHDCYITVADSECDGQEEEGTKNNRWMKMSVRTLARNST
jgi:hypothetical protein